MGFYKYVRDIWKKPNESMPEIMRERLISWRKEETSTVRLETPTRLDKARSLGYKAKKGVIVVRQRVPKGGHYRPRPGVRRSKRSGRRVVLSKSYQQIAEERANKKYPNCEVLNSYWVLEDGKHRWYEIILVDRDSPDIKNDKQLGWMHEPHHRGRVYRGLTSSGRKSRGLIRTKGEGAEKVRPSRTAVFRRKMSRRKKVR